MTFKMYNRGKLFFLSKIIEVEIIIIGIKIQKGYI